jgi:hypothetical protein
MKNDDDRYGEQSQKLVAHIDEPPPIRIVDMPQGEASAFANSNESLTICRFSPLDESAVSMFYAKHLSCQPRQRFALDLSCCFLGRLHATANSECDTRKSGSHKRVFMHWITNYTFGSHVADWLVMAAAVLLVIAVRIGTRSLVVWLLSHRRDSNKSEKDYWHIHGGE